MSFLDFLTTHWLGLLGYWLLILNGPVLCLMLRGKLGLANVAPDEIQSRCYNVLYATLSSAILFLVVYVFSLNRFLPRLLGE